MTLHPHRYVVQHIKLCPSNFLNWSNEYILENRLTKSSSIKNAILALKIQKQKKNLHEK